MWVSSFARGGASRPEASVSVRARVWGSEQAPRGRRQPRGGASGASVGPQDALTLAATADVALLRRLRVVHGSFVAVERQGRAHLARLVLVLRPDEIADADQDGEEEPSDVTLSPLLAFNLGIPLHAVNTAHVAVAVRGFAAYGAAPSARTNAGLLRAGHHPRSVGRGPRPGRSRGLALPPQAPGAPGRGGVRADRAALGVQFVLQ